MKYSDYAQGAAIVTGTVASANFLVLEGHPQVTGWAALLTTVLLAVSQWLQSKGD